MSSRRPTKQGGEERGQEADYDAWLEEADARSAQLESVVTVLHAELDKLARKSPTGQVSDLMVQRVNKAIRESHALMDREGDDFLQEVTEFIAAGDNPENRDVLLVLAELKAALSRFRSGHRADWLRH